MGMDDQRHDRVVRRLGNEHMKLHVHLRQLLKRPAAGFQRFEVFLNAAHILGRMTTGGFGGNDRLDELTGTHHLQGMIGPEIHVQVQGHRIGDGLDRRRAYKDAPALFNAYQPSGRKHTQRLPDDRPAYTELIAQFELRGEPIAHVEMPFANGGFDGLLYRMAEQLGLTNGLE